MGRTTPGPSLKGEGVSWIATKSAELKRVRDAKPNELADFPITDWLAAEVLRREAEEGVGASSS